MLSPAPAARSPLVVLTVTRGRSPAVSPGPPGMFGRPPALPATMSTCPALPPHRAGSPSSPLPGDYRLRRAGLLAPPARTPALLPPGVRFRDLALASHADCSHKLYAGKVTAGGNAGYPGYRQAGELPAPDICFQ